jgi:hypothetical protein
MISSRGDLPAKREHRSMPPALFASVAGPQIALSNRILLHKTSSGDPHDRGFHSELFFQGFEKWFSMIR